MDELKHQLYLSDLRIKKYLRADEFEAVEREEYNRQLILKQMEAKNKAKELVEKFYKCPEVQEAESKRCALIAVDEIIEEVREYCDDNFHQERLSYYHQVKQEIEAL